MDTDLTQRRRDPEEKSLDTEKIHTVGFLNEGGGECVRCFIMQRIFVLGFRPSMTLRVVFDHIRTGRRRMAQKVWTEIEDTYVVNNLWLGVRSPCCRPFRPDGFTDYGFATVAQDS